MECLSKKYHVYVSVPEGCEKEIEAFCLDRDEDLNTKTNNTYSNNFTNPNIFFNTNHQQININNNIINNYSITQNK